MWLLIAIGLWMLSIPVHATLCRIARSYGRFSLYVFTAGLCGTILITWEIAASDGSGEDISAILVFALLCELYLFVMTLTNSVTLRILSILVEQDLDMRDIQALYDGENIVSKRFDQLIETGMLISDGDGYTLTSTGRRSARIFSKLQSFAGKQPS
jgi:hypothetical protein